MSKEEGETAMAELKEKQRAYQEQQQTVDNLLATVRRLANRQMQARTEGRRATLTLTELTKLDSNHTVYQGVGRGYVRIPVNTLIEQQNAIKEKCEAEEQRLIAEKQRATEMVTQEQKELQKLEAEYSALASTVRNLFMQMQQQQQQQQQKGDKK